MSDWVNILAIQSYGYIRNEQDIGSGAIGSRARLLYGAMLVGTGRIQKDGLIALFPQGASKKSPFDPYQPTLGKMMAEYLAGRPEMTGIKIVHEPLGWGTWQDIQNTYKMIGNLGYRFAHIHFVSDPSHIKRVELIWNKTRPVGWTAEFHGASFHRMTWRERVIREPLIRLYYRFRKFEKV